MALRWESTGSSQVCSKFRLSPAMVRTSRLAARLFALLTRTKWNKVYRPYSDQKVCVKPTPLAANCSVKGCREQPLLFLFVGCGMYSGFNGSRQLPHFFNIIFTFFHIYSLLFKDVCTINCSKKE